MFITVRYGDDQSVLFNSDCRNIILLNNIKQRCKCVDENVVDLSDESGSVVNLSSHLHEYGKNYLMDKGSFILIRVETKMDDNGDIKTTYTPLLDGMESNKEYLDRLNPRPTKTGKKNWRRTTSSLSNDSGKGKDGRRKAAGNATRKISAVKTILANKR